MTWDIVGHDWAVTLLKRGLTTGRAAHAYLLCGPPQIGKTRLAVRLAQALNCAQPEAPCGTCPACRKIAKQAHPDVRLIVGEGAGNSIKIDQVRALQQDAVLSPYEGRYRVFILRQLDRATTEAANSLLKTLEEPPAQVVLILTAVHAETLPATVVSRCQRLDLRPTPCPVVESALLKREQPPAQAQLLARLSGGRMGWAIRASEQESLLQQRREDQDRLVDLLTADRVARLDFAWQASRDPVAARQMLECWASWWRDLLLLSSGAREDVVNTDRLDELVVLAEQSTVSQVQTVLQSVLEADAQLGDNVNARLALEGLMLKLPHRPPATA